MTLLYFLPSIASVSYAAMVMHTHNIGALFLSLSLSLSLYIPDNSFVSHISLIKWAKGTFYALIFRSCFLLSRLAQNVLLFDGDVIARGIKQMVDIFYVLYVHINAFMRKI